MQSHRPERRTEILQAVVICVLLAGVTLWAFRGVKNAEFASLDDPTYVSNNPIVQEGWKGENIKWAFTTFYFNNWHPLTWLSYMADAELFGVNASAFHMVNLGFHVANTVVLFLVLWRLTGAMWASGIVAAFFGWHPLHVESVTWISERKDVLSTLFWLLTMWAYGEYAKERRGGWYAGVLIFFVLGLMTKAMLVTLPFVLLLMDIWPLQRVNLAAPDWLKEARKLVWEKLPLFAIAGGASYVTYVAQAEAVRSMGEWMLTERIENALISYVRYLGKTFWPMDLAVFYPHPPAGWPEWQVMAAAALLAGISLCTFMAARKHPYVFTGWWWFVGTLVPVIGLVQIGSQSIADRYMYVPSIGLFIAVVWALREWTAARNMRKTAMASLTGAAIIICALLTARQVEHWKTPLALFMQAERTTPPNIVIFDHLITGFVNGGRTNEARARVKAAMETVPHEYLTWWHAGNMFLREGELDKAMEHYQKGLHLNPDSPELNSRIGLALHKQGRFQDAIAHYRRAIERGGGNLETEINLANALVAVGDAGPAVIRYVAMLPAQRDLAGLHCDLGGAYVETGKFEEAVKHLRQAVRLKPDLAPALNNLAWLMATHPEGKFRNGKEAVELAERACELTKRRQAVFLGTLAAAYAEGGRFEDAVTTAEKAAALAESEGQKEIAAKNRELLKSYRAGQPWREAPAGGAP